MCPSVLADDKCDRMGDTPWIIYDNEMIEC